LRTEVCDGAEDMVVVVVVVVEVVDSDDAAWEVVDAQR
jgi:hypothetical protein